MELETAIRTRRSTRHIGGEPLDPATIDELLDLARWAPNHHLTNPWRFRVLGATTIAKVLLLADALNPGGATKLGHAPTWIVVSSVVSDDPHTFEQDLLATGVAAYLVTLAAHGRGLASFWRSPAVLRTAPGRAAVGIEEGVEEIVGLIQLGAPEAEQRTTDRRAVPEILSYLD